MIEALRVFEVGALKHTELLNLGQINVICGKNNSGKSTLLAGIAQPEKRAAGRSIPADEIEAIALRAAEKSPWRRGSGYDSERSVYVKKVIALLSGRERWFANDVDILAQGIAQAVESNSILSRFAMNAGAVTHEVMNAIGSFPQPVLIPPKRNIQLMRGIALNEPVHPSGDGLLGYLFYAKNQAANTVDRQTFEQMLDAFSRISSGYRFDVFANRENQIALNFAPPGQAWLPGEACGLGLQDLLLLLYFVMASSAQVLLIEEPESHLHPDMQRRLLAFCRERKTKQLFVTTHSNVFLNNALIDRVFFTTFTDRVIVDDATSRASILDDLGYSVTDNLVSDLIILVEGPSDVPVVEEFLQKLGLLTRFQIKIWPLGGDIMDQLDLSVFASNYRLIALIDQDPSSAKIRRRFEKHCRETNVPVHRLARYAIENYFTVEALSCVYAGQFPAAVSQIKPDIPVEKQLGFSVKKRNRAIAKNMTWSDVEETDLGKFFQKIRKMLGA